MAVNNATLDLITSFEGWVPKWYPDPAHGWKVPTCCYGHTDAAGEPKYANTKDKVFTIAEGRAILAQDLEAVEQSMEHWVKWPLNENQHGALTSWTFNLGQGNLASSTMLKKINTGDMAGAAAEMLKWNRANGKVLAGLTRRRQAEAALFMKPVTGSTIHSTGTIPVTELPPPAAGTKPRTWGVLIAVLGPILYGIGKFLGIVP